MTDKLTEFLTNLATDDDLVAEFKKDKVATMKTHGVPENHIDLVVNKDYDAIQKELGSSYTIATNSVIRAFKK